MVKRLDYNRKLAHVIDSTIMERCSLSGGSYGERGETPYKELARRLGKM